MSALAGSPLPRQRVLLDRLASWFTSLTAGKPATADSADAASAAAKQKNTENAGFPVRGEMEQQVP